MKERKLYREDARTAYYATEDGRILSFRKKSGKTREIRPADNGNGYRYFIFYWNGEKKSAAVHRAVWEAFHGPIPSGLEINHINTIRDDNRLENLELVTSRQNHLHVPTREHYREAKRHKMKPVLDVTTGIRYESISEAACRTGLRKGNITHCCNGRIHQTGGHVFRYAS